MARHPGWKLSFDLLVMKNVAVSAMDDIWRYKVYHLASPDKRSDAVKRAAYFTKWLIKLRPIYYMRPYRLAEFKRSFDKEDSTLYLNELFAVFVSLQTIATDVRVEKLALSSDFLSRTYYDFHFRSMTDDLLLSLYQTIKDLGSGKKLIMT